MSLIVIACVRYEHLTKCWSVLICETRLNTLAFRALLGNDVKNSNFHIIFMADTILGMHFCN